MAPHGCSNERSLGWGLCRLRHISGRSRRLCGRSAGRHAVRARAAGHHRRPGAGAHPGPCRRRPGAGAAHGLQGCGKDGGAEAMRRALLIVTGLVAAAVAGGADFLTEPASAQVISGGGGAGASVASGASWYSQTYPNASVTGTAAETVLADVAVPANALGPVGMLRITTAWTTTNTANNKSLRTRFSATANNLAGTLLQQSIANSMAVVQIQFIVRNAGATG